MRTRTTTAAGLAALAVTAGLLGSPATAATTPVTPSPAVPGARPEPWQPETQEPFTVAAGVYCQDAFSYTPDRQDLSSRVLSRYADGAVRTVEFHGLLIGTFTNLRTGATVTTNASGTAVQQLREDGSLETYTTYGPVGLGFHAGDGFPQGYYSLDGVHVVGFAPDGTRTMLVDHGTEVDTCAALGG